MSDPAKKPLNYADLLAATLPDHPVPELVEGELVHKASPRGTHAFAHARMCVLLDPIAGGADGGWWILVEPDVIFGPHRVLRPDLAGWRREHLPEIPAGPIEVRPDWVCELLSPGHGYHDRGRKADLYAQEGLPHLWLVDPEARLLEAWSLVHGTWARVGAWTDAQRPSPPPFDLPIEVADLFPPRGRPPLAHERPPGAYRAG